MTIICFIFVFIASFTAVKLFSLPSVIWQGVFFVLAIITCELSVKYFIPVYTYIIDSESFIITKTLGKKVTTVCNVDLYRITDVVTNIDFENGFKSRVSSIYNYSCNPGTKGRYALIFEYSNCKEAVLFEPNEEMYSFILGLIKNQ
ncbi:MAG: hypothetical protein E7613_01025 [Ruminococcaceae bacterium]|nr:hypothetical protein [Oscillospiraceae bacterium]